MTSRRVTHAQQRAGKGLGRSDPLFERLHIDPIDLMLPVPEVYVLEFSPDVFDAIFGPQIGTSWAPTTAEFPELLDALDTPVNTRF